MKNIIVAYGKNRVIGNHGKLPWQGEMPADMKHFKEITIGSAIIMGRLTFESIGRPLPSRDNIVLTSSNVNIEGCQTAGSLDEAYSLVSEDKDSFVIGGESVYRQAIDTVDRLYITEIDVDKEGDKFFPAVDKNKWREIDREEHQPDHLNRYGYRFLVFEAMS